MKKYLLHVASKQIVCPSCGDILDYRTTVVSISPAGQQRINCAACWKKGLRKVHDANPHEYLISIGWRVIAMPATIKSFAPPPTTGERIKALKRHLRHRMTRPDPREFPKKYQYSTTAAYVAAYLEMNRLHFVGGTDGYVLNREPYTLPAIVLGRTQWEEA